MSKPVARITLLLLAALLAAYHILVDVTVRGRGVVRLEGDVVRVVTEAGGRIVSVNLREGARVRRGDVLVQLDTRDIQRREDALRSRIHITEQQSSALLRGELAALYRQLEQIRLEHSRLTITSPCDGRLMSVATLHPAEFLPSGIAVAAVAASDRLVVETWIPAAARPLVSPGQRVRLQSVSLAPGQYNAIDATIVSINSEVRFNEPQTGAYRVLLAPAPYSPPLSPGTTFGVLFVARRERVLWILFQKVRTGAFERLRLYLN